MAVFFDKIQTYEIFTKPIASIKGSNQLSSWFDFGRAISFKGASVKKAGDKLHYGINKLETYLKNAAFILLVVGAAKFVNSKLPNHPLDAFIPA